MTHRDSIPPVSGGAARQHFTAAVELLSHRPVPIRRTFEGSARDISSIASRLSSLLREGTSLGKSLSEIDSAASELMQKCLEVQQLTIKARKDGLK